MKSKEAANLETLGTSNYYDVIVGSVRSDFFEFSRGRKITI